MKKEMFLYVVQFAEGKYSLPFPAFNDHFATMALHDMPNHDGYRLWRVGRFDCSKGSLKGLAHMHEVF